MGSKASLAFISLGAVCFVGCGGGGGNGSTPPPQSPTIRSVSANCTAASLQTGQTTQCSAAVSGTGNYSSAVTWTALSGTITSSGLYTAPATVPTSGSDTVKATSTQDSTRSGTATVTVVPAPTITSVAVSCNAPSVQTGQTVQCSATVLGTGNFNSAVNWSVNGISGGNSTLGTISAMGLYTAPTTLPTPYTVTIAATSIADSSEAASVPIVVAGTIASVSHSIVAASGGTIALPDGSSVVIPANALPVDQNVTLSELSTLPQQPPNQLIVGTGTTLELAFSVPVQPSSSRIDGQRTERVKSTAAAASTAPALTFTIIQQGTPPGLNGAIGLTELQDTTNANYFLPTTYSGSSGTSSLAVSSSWLSGFTNPISSVAVSPINNANLIIPWTLPSGTSLPIELCWQPEIPNWPGFSTCSGQIAGKRVLVVVHGMMTCVEDSFTPLAQYMQEVQTGDPYDVIVGFDYDWTRHLTDNGDDLEVFLEQIAKLKPKSIDIVAHSEGVPVSLYAASQMPDRALIRDFFSLAGPILGTPVPKDPLADRLIYFHYEFFGPSSCPASQSIQQMGFDGLFASPFVQDLQPGSAALAQTILPSVRNNLGPTPIFVAGGINEGTLALLYDSSGSPFPGPNDGIVGLDSALAFNSGFPVHPFPPFDLFHSNLPSDTSTNGVLSDIAIQAEQNTAAQLSCVGLSGDCEGAQDSQFGFSGADFGVSAGSIEFFSQDSTGAVTYIQTPTLTDSSGNIAWTMPPDTQQVGVFSVFAFDGAQILASNNVMQTVSAAAPPITVSISPPSVTSFFGGTQSFTATVTGTTNTSVSWSIQEGSPGGTITSAGLYTAPTTASTYHVIATSQADTGATASATVTVLSPANNPVPQILGLSPSSVQVGTSSQTLTINGTGFLSSSTVTFNGIGHTATLESPTQLQISLTSTDLSTAGIFPIVVTNPTPGGGSSGIGNFTVINGQIANDWTWISGSDLVNGAPVYGTLDIGAPTNVPGARGSAVSWTDGGGNLWLFGGWGVDSSGDYWGNLNDLWTFNPSGNVWTWVSGGKTANAAGVYGTQGVASASNVPGARSGATSWIDNSGNLWLFGGSTGVVTFSNDLWEYSLGSQTWTWMSGANVGSQSGTYGSIGVPSTANVPGARSGAVSWIDSGGNLWLFGGQGYDSAGASGYLNDLWEFNPTNKTWTWVSGSSTLELFADGLRGEPGAYGTEGIPNTVNVPCGRLSANGWIDKSGNLWLFGGFGQDSTTSGNSVLNDLWEFNPTAKTWTWVSGANVSSQPGTYGTIGVPGSTNVPGARQESFAWTDANGNLWLFGGIGYDSVGYYQYLNDLWEFNLTNKTWTWMGGSNRTSASGLYGTLGVPAPTNVPGSRDQSVGWIDPSGNLWLLGGYGSDSVDSGGYLNDLWRYQL